MSIFDKFNEKVDVAKLANDKKEIAEKGGTGNYEDVPLGDYFVKIDKMEITTSKNGDPMFTTWFRIQEGKEQNRLIFMNQLIVEYWQIGIVDDFLRSLDTGYEVEFDTSCKSASEAYEKYNNLVLDIHEACDHLEFKLRYGENKKGFKNFKILEVFDA